MASITVNLVPLARREMHHKKARVRFWLMTSGAYGLCWLVIALLIGATGFNDDTVLRQELDQLNALVGSSESELSQMRGELGRFNVELATSRAIGRQPDWSILLVLLSSTLGDHITLRNCTLETSHESLGTGGPQTAIATNNASAPSGIPDAANIQLELIGLGLSQQAVSEFVLRLEEMTLFRQVKLIETRREPYLESEAIAFRIVCVFQTAEVSQP